MWKEGHYPGKEGYQDRCSSSDFDGRTSSSMLTDETKDETGKLETNQISFIHVNQWYINARQKCTMSMQSFIVENRRLTTVKPSTGRSARASDLRQILVIVIEFNTSLEIGNSIREQIVWRSDSEARTTAARANARAS